MDYFKVLDGLSSRCAVSGFEDKMSSYIKSLFGKYCDKVEVDRFYNVIGFKKGQGKNTRILITAHYDEIGFIVKSIDEFGFIKLAAMGGVDSKILLAQEVIIHGKRDVFGVIGAKPPHLLKPGETQKAVKLEQLYVDVGMCREEVEKIISIGNPVSLKSEAVMLKGNKVSAKSMDNRCSILSMLQMLEELKDIQHDNDLYFAATVQEEFNAVGAAIASYGIRPDIAVVIDTCHGEIPEIPKEDVSVVGKGPSIGIGPNMHRKLSKKLIDISIAENISYQIDIEPGDSGTEAWVTQVSRSGIPTILVSIPLKYMHTAIETISLEDIKNTGKLVAKLLLKSEQELEG